MTRSRADRQPRPAPDRGRRRLHEGVARLLHHRAHGGHRPRELLGHPLLDLPEPLLRHLRLRDLRLAHDRGPGQDASRAGVLFFLFSRARTEARPPRSRRPERAAAAQGGGPALQPRAPARERGVDRVLRRRGPRGRGGRRAPRPRRGEQARDPGHAAEPRVLHDGVHVPRADPARARRVAALLRGHDRARRRDAVGGGVQINGASMAWGRVGSRTGRRAPSTTSSTT